MQWNGLSSRQVTTLRFSSNRVPMEDEATLSHADKKVGHSIDIIMAMKKQIPPNLTSMNTVQLTAVSFLLIYLLFKS